MIFKSFVNRLGASPSTVQPRNAQLEFLIQRSRTRRGYAMGHSLGRIMRLRW